jgi:iron complex transport system permease protein
MNRKSIFVILWSFGLLVLLLFILDIALGSVAIPLKSSLRIITGSPENENWTYIILQLRLPRAVNAVLTGAGLALAGLMMQTLFRNPLAGPYVLGISSGASLGVALFVMAASFFSIESLVHFNLISNWGQVIAAMAGAILIFLFIVSVASRVKDSVSLLIVGIMFGSLTTAIVSVLQYFSEPELVQKFVIWTMGSLSSTGWYQLQVMIPFVFAGIILSVFLIKPMNALLLGENNARAMGVHISRLRYLILISTCIIAGSLTAFNGPVAFIGMAVPHLVRMLFNTSNHRIVLPGAVIFGSGLLLICDTLSQVPGKNMVLPINAVTALFGAPVVLWIILGRKTLRSSF